MKPTAKIKSLTLSRSFSVDVNTALRNEQCYAASEELTIEERYIYIHTHTPLWWAHSVKNNSNDTLTMLTIDVFYFYYVKVSFNESLDWGANLDSWNLL